MPELLVVIPTVAERAAECARTVAQWVALGVSVATFLTPAGLPRGPRTHGRIGRLALAEGAERAGAVLFCEDDVDLAPDLARHLPTLLSAGRVITLYLPGSRFYPTRLRQGPWPELRLTYVVGLRQWFGSQCLLLPRAVAAALAREPEPEKDLDAGLDMVVRRWLLREGQTLWATVPNLAQHRSPPSVTSPRYKAHHSISFGREALPC